MDYQVDTLARTIYGEARANDADDARAIACVVMNRVGYRNWPSNPAAVCKQPWQFSCWNQNDPNLSRIVNASGPWFEECCAIAQMAVNGQLADETGTATHYLTRAVQSKTFWAKGKVPCFETAGHLYYNDIDTPAPVTAKDALDQQRPLSQSRTIKGASVAGVMTIIGPLAGEVSSSLEQYSHLSDVIKWGCVILGALGAGWAIWARLHDRARGLV
ncbi:cell wall hydrolase [Thalassospira sp. SM2505]